MRRILHLDMDAFFAAIEQMRHPELVGKPIIIGGDGDPTKRGVVSTASYEARKFGIHSAMPLRRAYRLCPEAVFLPVDYDEYLKVSEKIKGILRSFTSLVEDIGIDEAFLDITDLNISSEEIAMEIKKKIKDELNLTCSIGIAPNKLLAKIASDIKKPDGLSIISEKDIERLIWPLPVRKLWGVGPKTEVQLKNMGISIIGELASISLGRLIEYFGKSYSNYLYEASRGIDESPVITHWEPKSMSRETTFQRDTDDWNTIAKNLAELTREVVDNMKGSGYKGKTVTIKIRFSNFETHTRAKTLDDFTNSIDILRKAAFEALGRIELKKKVRLIGVRIGRLARG
ncbi:MAG: DNA polymerase IV [Thermodesulfovibrionales bacterium]|nr:DNA polymerase IV [Thermodesulfovibrionales bacterium]